MAYIRRRRNYRKRPATKRNTIRKAFAKKRNANITRVVKKVIGRQAETKVLQYSGSLSIHNVNINSTQAQFNTQVFSTTPQGATISGLNQGYPVLGNGIGQDQRVADECKIKAQYLKYIIYPKPYDATFNPVPAPQIVMMWLIQPKLTQAGDLIVDNFKVNAASMFFENQTNADSGLGGSLTDLIRKVDTDNYRVVAYREHKIGYDGNLNSGNTLSTLPSSNTYKAYVQGRIKINGFTWKCNRQDVVQNRPIYLLVQTIRADNTAVVPSYIPVQLDFNLTTFFTDM